MSEEEKKAIKDFLELREIHSNDSMTISYLSIYQNAVKKMSKLLENQKKEIEEKSTIIMVGAEKVKQLEKEIEELQTKLEIEKIDNKYNQEERDEETIPRCKIREKIKELENKNEKNKIELAKGIDMLSFDLIEKARINILINVNVRDILKELLEDK